MIKDRSQWIALAVVIALGIGLLAAPLGGRSSADSETAVDAAAPDGTDPSSSARDVDGQQDNTDNTGDADAADESADPSDDDSDSEAPPVLRPAPALVELDGWINTNGTDDAALAATDGAGTVRIVQFWTFGCFNCKNTLPHLQDIYDRYEADGLEIIGVHAPEFDFEADPVAIENASAELGVRWPVALDTDKTNFRSWQETRRFWPRTYVIDQDGQIRFDHIGEGAYDELEATVAHLLSNGA